MVHDLPWHGGPDALGVPLHDFSTNANAAGPCPQALVAVQSANPALYPDPQYTDLRARLAHFHGVTPSRVLLAASASEAMFRFAAAARQLGAMQAWRPSAHYGDVARATHAAGLMCTDTAAHADVLWACEPSTPEGAAMPDLPGLLTRLTNSGAIQQGQTACAPQLLLDRAYEPLRLSGASSLDAAVLDRVWQLWSPNKALGLTGVRGAYLLAPLAPEGDTAPQTRAGAAAWRHTLETLAPSWPLGAHAVAMLQAWCTPAVQQWVKGSLPQLAQWKAVQLATLTRLGWTCLPSQTNYFLARPPQSWLARRPLADLLAAWRAAHGIKLRDATSFGHPGWVRLGVRPPTQPCIWETLSCP